MKLLSLWEPWATLMSLGAKRIETRSWSTSYRGWLAIQASKGGLNQGDRVHTCCQEPFLSVMRGVVPASVKRGFIFPHGKIVAVVYLRACPRTQWLKEPFVAGAFGELMTPQEREFGDYSDGRYGWVTDSLFRLPEPIPFKAMQGLMNVPAEVVEQIRQQWKGAPR